MTITITTAHNDARLGGSLTYLNTGAGVARIRIFGNTRPAVTDAPGEDPLVEMELADPAGSVSAGVLTLDPDEDAMILVSGDAVWARVVNGNGDTVFDCDVSATGGVGEIQLPSVTLYAGGLTRLTSGTLG